MQENKPLLPKKYIITAIVLCVLTITITVIIIVRKNPSSQKTTSQNDTNNTTLVENAFLLEYSIGQSVADLILNNISDILPDTSSIKLQSGSLLAIYNSSYPAYSFIIETSEKNYETTVLTDTSYGKYYYLISLKEERSTTPPNVYIYFTNNQFITDTNGKITQLYNRNEVITELIKWSKKNINDSFYLTTKNTY